MVTWITPSTLLYICSSDPDRTLCALPVLWENQTCFWDGLEVSFEDCSIPLPAERERDQHHVPGGRQLHDRWRTRNRQPTPPETSKWIMERFKTYERERDRHGVKRNGWRNVLTWRLSCSVAEARSHTPRACEQCSFLAWRRAGWGRPVEPHDPMAHGDATGSMASWDSRGSGCGCCHTWHRGQRTWLDGGKDGNIYLVLQHVRMHKHHDIKIAMKITAKFSIAAVQTEMPFASFLTQLETPFCNIKSPWKPSCHFPLWMLFGFLLLSDFSSDS